MQQTISPEDIRYLGGCTYELYADYMLTPAYIVAPENTHDTLFQDRSLHQIANVAQIPGIQPHPWVMPDMHEGYGFPIGGVAATAIEEGGIISPGGIGYDINCGVRLLVTTIPAHALRQHADRVASQLQKAVPSGLWWMMIAKDNHNHACTNMWSVQTS